MNSTYEFTSKERPKVVMENIWGLKVYEKKIWSGKNKKLTYL